MADNPNPSGEQKIIVRDNGPYRVLGGIPFVHKTQVVSELGEPLSWNKDASFAVDPVRYSLCRCGKSQTMPFCDDTHKTSPFDGTEGEQAGNPLPTLYTYKRTTNIVVRRDITLCISAGFCAMASTNIAKLVANTDDTRTRSLVMAMVERCPSGSLTYTIEEGQADIEPDLPLQIADTTEITAEGPRLAEGARTRAQLLTPRELEILAYLAKGLSKKDIARTVGLSIKTVEQHCTHLMQKLDIHDRVELARFAIREGLVQP